MVQHDDGDRESLKLKTEKWRFESMEANRLEVTKTLPSNEQ